MKNFEVVIIQEETYCFEVSAKSEEEAASKALKLFESDKDEYHTDSDGKTTVSEL